MKKGNNISRRRKEAKEAASKASVNTTVFTFIYFVSCVIATVLVFKLKPVLVDYYSVMRIDSINVMQSATTVDKYIAPWISCVLLVVSLMISAG